MRVPQKRWPFRDRVSYISISRHQRPGASPSLAPSPQYLGDLGAVGGRQRQHLVKKLLGRRLGAVRLEGGRELHVSSSALPAGVILLLWASPMFVTVPNVTAEPET